MTARVTGMSPEGVRLLMDLEGNKLKAYQDSAGLYTISVGVTRYPDGTRVKKGDTLASLEASAELFKTTRAFYEKSVDDLTRDDLNQYQFDALVCLAYNIGVEGFRTSTVRKLVNRNPLDPAITEAFKQWRRAGGNPKKLLGRRITEANWYFGGES